MNRSLVVTLLLCATACGKVQDTADAAGGGSDAPATCTPACGTDQECVNGTCVMACAGALVACGTTCVDPTMDVGHCGAKGTCSSTDPASPDYAGEVCGGAIMCVAGMCDDGTVSLTVTASRNNYDVFVEAGSPTTAKQVTVTIAPNITIGSANRATPAFTTGALPAGSTVTLTLGQAAQIIGAGGAGGSGGNGGGGGASTPCGRPGIAGGTGIVATVAMTITNGGLIAGGGGGGGGMSGCNINAGGGGGAGNLIGAGGAAASTTLSGQQASEITFCGQDNLIRTGVAGAVGGPLLGGAGGVQSSGGAGGKGGDLGRPGAVALSCITGSSSGVGAGGAAGYAIRRGSQTVTGVADGTYGTGAGPVRGPVGP